MGGAIGRLRPHRPSKRGPDIRRKLDELHAPSSPDSWEIEEETKSKQGRVYALVVAPLGKALSSTNSALQPRTYAKRRQVADFLSAATAKKGGSGHASGKENEESTGLRPKKYLFKTAIGESVTDESLLGYGESSSDLSGAEEEVSSAKRDPVDEWRPTLYSHREEREEAGRQDVGAADSRLLLLEGKENEEARAGRRPGSRGSSASSTPRAGGREGRDAGSKKGSDKSSKSPSPRSFCISPHEDEEPIAKEDKAGEGTWIVTTGKSGSLKRGQSDVKDPFAWSEGYSDDLNERPLDEFDTKEWGPEWEGKAEVKPRRRFWGRGGKAGRKVVPEGKEKKKGTKSRAFGRQRDGNRSPEAYSSGSDSDGEDGESLDGEKEEYEEKTPRTRIGGLFRLWW